MVANLKLFFLTDKINKQKLLKNIFYNPGYHSQTPIVV